MNTYEHTEKPFGFDPFGKNDEPNISEIRFFRLWRCPDCGLWYSLCGD